MSDAQETFRQCAQTATRWSGSPWLFFASLVGTMAWVVVGPLVGFTDPWHLWMTSVLTILTWLQVVLVQHAQHTHEHALHLKLDELIRAIGQADNRLIGIENKPSEEQ
jgi:low affinity Fe/Cu permease